MKRSTFSLAVFLIGVVTGWLALPLLPSQAEQWVVNRSGETNTAAVQQQAAGGPPTVTPDAVRPANAVFELLPQAGLLSAGKAAFGNAPVWADADADQVAVTNASVIVNLRNLTGSTLKAPYWAVRAFGRTPSGWMPGASADITDVEVAPGERTPFGATLSAVFPPDTSAVRFTVTYREPGVVPSSATLEYPW